MTQAKVVGHRSELVDPRGASSGLAPIYEPESEFTSAEGDELRVLTQAVGAALLRRRVGWRRRLDTVRYEHRPTAD